MKRFQVKTLYNISGKPFRTVREDDSEPTEATLVDLLKSFVYALPPSKLTMQDSIEAKRLFESLLAAKDELVLEEGTHDWLKKRVEELSPQIFGVNAICVKEALDDFTKAHEKKE